MNNYFFLLALSFKIYSAQSTINKYDTPIFNSPSGNYLFLTTKDQKKVRITVITPQESKKKVRAIIEKAEKNLLKQLETTEIRTTEHYLKWKSTSSTLTSRITRDQAFLDKLKTTKQDDCVKKKSADLEFLKIYLQTLEHKLQACSYLKS